MKDSDISTAYYIVNKKPSAPVLPPEIISTSAINVDITIPEGITYIYTTDGSEPTLENGIKLTKDELIKINQTTRMKIRAFSSEGVGSEVIETIIRVLELKEVKIINKPEKLNYFTGDELDTKGLKVNALYDDGEKKEEKEVTTECKLEGFDSETAGEKTVTVSWKEKEDKFTVNVEAVTSSSIAIKTPATKLSYYVGEPLDIAGLTVEGT